MKRHSLDAKIMDFTWKQNRLSKDKELLKNSMLDVLNKKKKEGKEGNSVMPRESGAPGHGINSGMNTGMAAQYGNTGGVQAGGTMMGM